MLWIRSVGLACLLTLTFATGCEWFENAFGGLGDLTDAKPPEKRFAKFMATFDRNKDGRVQFTELPENKQAEFVGADVDGDGIITLAELEAFRAQTQRARFDQNDQDKNGVIEAREVSADLWERLKRADDNRDGRVTFEELRSLVDRGGLGTNKGKSKGQGQGQGQGQGRGQGQGGGKGKTKRLTGG